MDGFSDKLCKIIVRKTENSISLNCFIGKSTINATKWTLLSVIHISGEKCQYSYYWEYTKTGWNYKGKYDRNVLIPNLSQTRQPATDFVIFSDFLYYLPHFKETIDLFLNNHVCFWPLHMPSWAELRARTPLNIISYT